MLRLVFLSARHDLCETHRIAVGDSPPVRHEDDLLKGFQLVENLEDLVQLVLIRYDNESGTGVIQDVGNLFRRVGGIDGYIDSPEADDCLVAGDPFGPVL